MGEVDDLRANAERCRRLSRAVLDIETTRTLERMASELDDEAERLEQQVPAVPLLQDG